MKNLNKVEKTLKKLLNRTPRYGKVEVDDQCKHAAYENETTTLQSTLIIVEQCTSQWLSTTNQTKPIKKKNKLFPRKSGFMHT